MDKYSVDFFFLNGSVGINVGSQIILSQILEIQNSNHAQEHKYLRGKPFLFEGKNFRTNFE